MLIRPCQLARTENILVQGRKRGSSPPDGTTNPRAISYVVPFGARFAWGRAVEDSTVAYRPWRQAFRRLGIPFPLPDAGPTVSPDERSGQLLAIGEAAVSALSEASGEEAIVIALDDIHWADDASLHLLWLLSSEVAEMKVMLLATSRPPERALPPMGLWVPSWADRR